MYRNIVVMIIVMLLLSSCSSATLVETPENDVKNNVIINEVNISKITKDMSREDVFSLLGSSDYDFQSSVYPLVYSWEIDDNKLLTVVFKIDGCETQNDYLEEYKKILSSNDNDLTNNNEDAAPHLITAEQSNEVKEWLNINAKAIEAYIVEGKEKTVLFD